MIYLWGSLIGLASGLFSGLFGVGGGIIMVPAMVLLLGCDMKRAVGTSLAIIIPTAIAGSIRHYKNGNIDPVLLLAIVPCAVLSGYLGAWVTQHVSSDFLKRAFGVFLVLVGLHITLGRRHAGPASNPAPPPPASTSPPSSPGAT